AVPRICTDAVTWPDVEAMPLTFIPVDGVKLTAVAFVRLAPVIVRANVDDCAPTFGSNKLIKVFAVIVNGTVFEVSPPAVTDTLQVPVATPDPIATFAVNVIPSGVICTLLTDILVDGVNF